MRPVVPVARRTMLADRRRLVISTLGVGLAVALILLLEGLWAGVLDGVSAYPERVGASLFVREPNTRNLIVGTVPLSALDAVRAVSGVREANPVIARYVILNLHETKEAVSVIGFEPGGLGGPWQIPEGRDARASGEVVMDQSLARTHDIRVGDGVVIQGRRCRVVGLSDRTRTLFGGGFLFMTFQSAQSLFGQTQTATFILAKTADPRSAAAAIRGRTGLAADRPEVVSSDQRAVYAGVLGRIFDLIILIAFLAGTMIVALTVYSAVVDRLPEYGIMKAMGAGPRRLFAIVAGQTLVLSGAGTLTGLVLFAAASRLLALVRPEDPSRLSPGALAGVILAAGAMALLAAIIPTHRVARLDPATVYRR